MEQLLRIVSGGQSGVDRAALDAALRLGLACGGWCPRGRRAEDGVIPSLYPLRETRSVGYARRTEWNVRDSDGTLVLSSGSPRGGTALTVELARAYGRPLCLAELEDWPEPQAVRSWLAGQTIHTLNVAGPRESERPGIYGLALAYLLRLLEPYQS